VVGGSSAISNSLLLQLPSPHRITGANRYDTNLNIINYFSGYLNLSTSYLATGESFPDALSGSALAALKKAPIILVNSPLSSTTRSYIRDRIGTINQVVAFGGTSAVPDSIITNITGTGSSSRPPTPGSVTAYAVGANQITLSWSPVSTATSYYIYRSTSYYGNYTYIASTSSQNYTDSGLAYNTTYYYKIVAVNSAGSSDYSPIASATTITYPSAPSGLTATPISGNQIYLTWYSSSNATNYYIYRSTSYSGSYTFVASTSNTYYTDSGLSNNTTYYYRIAAVNSLGISDYSTIAYATTNTNYPTKPTGLRATATSASQISLSWNAANYASSYYIYRSTSASGDYQYIGSTSSTSYTDTGLSSSTQYYYKIRAYNSIGFSDYTEAVSAITHSGTIPSVPTGLTAVAVDGALQINLTWTAVSGATSYTIARSTSADGPYDVTMTATTNSYTDNNGLSPNTTYYYKVSATNTAGSSTYSTAVSALTVPDKPTVTATPSETTITLNWTDVPGAVKYIVYVSSPTDDNYGELATINKPLHSFLHSELIRGATYYYKVQAVNSENKKSAFSTPVNATTVPPKPTNLIATVNGQDKITLNWDPTPGADYYVILRASDPSGPYTEIEDGLIDTNFSDTGLTAGTTYYYKVRAVNTAGSAESDEVSAITDS